MMFHNRDTKKKRFKTFYAHPYSFWERSSNENANKLIRRFVPKGTDIKKLKDKNVRRIEQRGGILNKKMKWTPEEKAEKVLAYLQEKYGEEFVPVSISQSGWGQGHDVIYAYSKDGTKENTFPVWGTIMDDGSYAMRDGYFGILIKDEYEAVMSGIVNGIYQDFKLYTSFGKGIVFPDRLNKDTEIDEIYHEDELFTSDTAIFLKESSAKGIDVSESLKIIAQSMKEKKLVGEVSIYIAYDEQFETISREILSKNTEDYLAEGSGRYIWVNPNLEIDEVK